MILSKPYKDHLVCLAVDKGHDTMKEYGTIGFCCQRELLFKDFLFSLY